MKTGMVLEGGAVRTIYSTGVCDALLTRRLDDTYGGKRTELPHKGMTGRAAAT